MRRRSARLLAAAAAASAVLVLPALAEAATPSIVVQDGVTQPVFGYTDAIRERVWVEVPFDTDSDGFTDRVALDIIRPAASDDGLKVPVVMDASPYYTTLGRGNESELMTDVDNDGLNDRWPLFYDNYFVPRGYAVVLLQMIGTGFSSGCPTTGGTPDNLSAKYGIDWLNGRVPGYDKDGNLVVADWHNGKTGMIGKSYDGTLANATAATGVDGLTTIVPISAISSWYDYTRSNGIRLMGPNYPSFLSNAVTNPSRRALCATFRNILNATDGDETNDYTPFWAERDYNPHVGNVKASVFVVHGVNDNNVKPDHFGKWWAGLRQAHVERKIWLTLTGHVDPFDFRREEWVRTLHRWFDFWLQDVRNGIIYEPEADVERSADVWETFGTWPDPGAEKTPVYLKAVAGAPGEFSFQQPNRRTTPDATFLDTGSQSQTTMMSNPTTLTPNRLVYLSPELTAPLKISGTPELFLRAAADQIDTNLGVLLVDYGTATRVAWNLSGEGITTLPTGAENEDCWGPAGSDPTVENACYRKTVKRVQTTAMELVTKGILDAVNRNSYATAENLVPGQEYDFGFPLLPEDYVFQAGHRIGVVLVGSYSGYSASTGQDEPNGATPRANITVSGRFTRILLPIVGGKKAALDAGLTG
jgi:X-Pro dipeptidyl-peptidase